MLREICCIKATKWCYKYMYFNNLADLKIFQVSPSCIIINSKHFSKKKRLPKLVFKVSFQARVFLHNAYILINTWICHVCFRYDIQKTWFGYTSMLIHVITELSRGRLSYVNMSIIDYHFNNWLVYIRLNNWFMYWDHKSIIEIINQLLRSVFNNWGHNSIIEITIQLLEI